MAYEGEDLTNYQAGYEYLPQKQYSLDYTLPTSTTEEQVTQNFGIPYTGAFTRSGGGGGGGASAGSSLSDIYGYDPNAGIMVDRDVWSGTDWVNTPKEAFMTSHGLVDKYGRNLDHLGLGDKIPSLLGSIFDKNWGQRKVGDVKGLFTEGLSSGIDQIKEGWEDEKEKWAGVLGITKFKAFKKAKALEEKNKIEQLKNEAAAEKERQSRKTHGTWAESMENVEAPQGGGTTYQQTGHGKSGMGRDPDRFAADGGRIGYKKGGREDRMGGTMEQTSQELRDAAPDQFGGGMNISHGGAGEGTISKLNVSPVFKTRATDLGFNIPEGIGLQGSSKWGDVKAMMNYRDLLQGRVKPTFTYDHQVGPVTLSANLSEEEQNINAMLNQGNFSAGAGTDFDDFGIGFKYSRTLPMGWSAKAQGGRAGLKYGGLVGIL